MSWYHSNPRLVPSPQELVGLSAAELSTEITNIDLVLAGRYAPNGSYAELVDGLQIEGRSEQRAFWADITRYKSNLRMAQRIQALEGPTGGIGMLDARTNNDGPAGSRDRSYGW